MGPSPHSLDGTGQVHQVHLQRRAPDHDFQDWSVQITLADRPDQVDEAGGTHEADEAHEARREGRTLPLENDIVVDLAQRSQAASMEAFAQELAGALLARSPTVTTAQVWIESHLWKRLVVNGAPHPSALMKGSEERQTTHVLHNRHGRPQLLSGFTKMTVLHTEQHTLRHAPHELTHEPGGTERLLAIEIDAEWTFTDEALLAGVPFARVRHLVRDRILSTFALHGGWSLQELLQTMAASALAASELVGQISMRLVSRPLPIARLTRSAEGHADQGRPDSHCEPADEPLRTVATTLQRTLRHG